jgi:hypothetical protein
MAIWQKTLRCQFGKEYDDKKVRNTKPWRNNFAPYSALRTPHSALTSSVVKNSPSLFSPCFFLNRRAGLPGETGPRWNRVTSELTPSQLDRGLGRLDVRGFPRHGWNGVDCRQNDAPDHAGKSLTLARSATTSENVRRHSGTVASMTEVRAGRNRVKNLHCLPELTGTAPRGGRGVWMFSLM